MSLDRAAASKADTKAEIGHIAHQRGGLGTAASELQNRADQFTWPLSTPSGCRADDLQERGRLGAARSADGVPAFGKWNKRPRQLVVVDGLRRLAEGKLAGQEILLRSGRNRRSHGIQQ
jgi:hypothetical protein